MTVFMITLGVFGIALAAMAVGVMFGNRPISGSCGGLGNMTDDRGQPICDVCQIGTRPPSCTEVPNPSADETRTPDKTECREKTGCPETECREKTGCPETECREKTGCPETQGSEGTREPKSGIE